MAWFPSFEYIAAILHGCSLLINKHLQIYEEQKNFHHLHTLKLYLVIELSWGIENTQILISWEQTGTAIRVSIFELQNNYMDYLVLYIRYLWQGLGM